VVMSRNRKPLRIRRKTGASRQRAALSLERLEDRIVLNADSLFFQALDSTPLTLRQSGVEIQIVKTQAPFEVLTSRPMAEISAGVRVEGNGHDVSLTIDASVPPVVGGILFVGGSGTDTLLGPHLDTDWVLNGPGAGVALGSTGVAFQFEGVENLLGGSGIDTFKVDPSGSLVGTLDGGGGTDDALVGDNTVNSWNIRGANQGSLNDLISFQSIENLIGGTDNDTFIFDHGAEITGVIEGGGEATADVMATDTMDYSSELSPYLTPVLVNLGTSQATGTAGFSNIDMFIGGSSPDDSILGPAEASVLWTVSGLDEGSVANFSFRGFENLIGAANNSDAFVIEGEGRVSGKIDGGAGGIDALLFIDPEDDTLRQVFNVQEADSSGDASAYGKEVTYFGLDFVNYRTEDTQGNLRISGTIFNDTIRIFTDPTDSTQLTILGAGQNITLTSSEVTFLQSLRIDALEGSDTIIVESLPANFSGSCSSTATACNVTTCSTPTCPRTIHTRTRSSSAATFRSVTWRSSPTISRSMTACISTPATKTSSSARG
jgi:hypothetical protein